MFSVLLSNDGNNREIKALENSKKSWKHSPVGSCFHSIFRSPKLPIVLLWLDRNTRTCFWFLKHYCMSSSGSDISDSKFLIKTIINVTIINHNDFNGVTNSLNSFLPLHRMTSLVKQPNNWITFGWGLSFFSKSSSDKRSLRSEWDEFSMTDIS